MPEVELFATLATGNVTESLQEFFSEYLTSQVCDIVCGTMRATLIHADISVSNNGNPTQNMAIIILLSLFANTFYQHAREYSCNYASY